MPDVNYILHLNAFFQKISNDQRLRPVHVSLYMALFHFWNNARFTKEFFICRAEVMQQARVGSKGTYHRCLNELNDWKYINYKPSHSPNLGSRINMTKFRTSTVQVEEHYHTKNCTTSVLKTEQVVGPYINYIKHNKHINDYDENTREDTIINIDILFDNYLKNKKLMAAVMSSQKISEEQLKNQLKSFVEKLKTEGKFSKTTDDFNTHFVRWLKIQLKNHKKESYGKLTGINAAFD